MMLAAAIKSSGANCQDFNLSYSTVRRKRLIVRKEGAESVKSQWRKPSHPIVHWDSKMIKYLGGKQEERIAILVSSPPKLLGIPAIGSSTGVDQKNAVISLLEKWELVDEVVGLCYDTTASNSGAHQGACKLIENEIGRPLLWLPCRHHVSELHVKHAAKAVTGETKSPNDLLFQRFKESFPTISKENIKLWQWPKDKDSFLARQANEVRNWTKIAIEQDTFPREDYRELCQLIALFLGTERSSRFQIRKPGAVHHARFMAKSIYYIKIFILSSNFKMSPVEKKMFNEWPYLLGCFMESTFCNLLFYVQLHLL